MKNDTMRFIDSCVGNIARKIEDEFNENDHPRDKGGKFTSKGNEGKGGKSEPDTAKTFHSAKQVGEEVKKDLREKYAKAHGGEQLPETEIEKAAKEELSSHEQKLAKLKKEDEEFNKMSNELLKIASDLDTANDALRALGWDDDYDDLELAHEALKEAIRRDPETAKELLENTPSRESDTPDYLKYAGDTPEGKETDSIYEEFKGSGIDMYAALSDLGLDVFNTPESYLEDAFKEALFNSPKFRKKAKQYISEYRRIDPDEEEDWFK